MKARVVWHEEVRPLLTEMPAAESELIFERLDLLQRYPRMYSVIGKGRFRRHRRFLAGNWIVYYRFVEGIVYIRAVWPARIP